MQVQLEIFQLFLFPETLVVLSSCFVEIDICKNILEEFYSLHMNCRVATRMQR